jgi:ABC-type nitrate/sulfonate/bicarbonate transport system permease component
MITAYRLIAFAVFILLWWAASFTSPFIPTPAATAAAAGVMFTADVAIYRAIAQSLFVYGTGLGLGILVGIPLGLLMGGFRIFGRTL